MKESTGVKRAFKAILSLTTKKKQHKNVEKQTGSPAGDPSLYFKIKSPLFCIYLFFKEYLNPQVRSNYQVSVTIKVVPSHIFTEL